MRRPPIHQPTPGKQMFKGDRNAEIEKDIESTRATWIEPQRAFLVSLLVEFSSREHRTDNGWTSRAWIEIVKQFKEKFPGANFTKAQIKDQEQRLKKKFKSLKRVLSMSGMGWNNDLKQIDPQDVTVEEALMNDKDACQWLGKSFPYYNDLFDIYNGCIAEGSRKRASTQCNFVDDSETYSQTPSPTIGVQNESQQRFDWEDDFINTDTYPSFTANLSNNYVSNNDTMDASFDLPTHQNASLGESTEDFNNEEAELSPTPPATQRPSANQKGSSTNLQRKGKRVKINETNFSPFNEDYFAYKREEQAKYINAWKEIKGQKEEKYSISAAMKAFKELPGFTFDDYDRATDLFVANPAFREVFLTFEPDERLAWITKRI